MSRCLIAKVFVLLMAALSLGITGCSSGQLGMANNIASTSIRGAGGIADGVLSAVSDYTGSPGVDLARRIVGTSVGGVDQITNGVLSSVQANQQSANSSSLPLAPGNSNLPVLSSASGGQLPLLAGNSGTLRTPGSSYSVGSNLGGGNLTLN